MSLIIDTHNLLHAALSMGDRAASLDLPKVVRLLSYGRYARRRATLVCDGLPATRGPLQSRLGAAEVVYSGSLTDADSIIEDLVAHHTAPRDLLVVSTDRRVQRAARARRAGAIRSDSFVRLLLADASAALRGQPEPAFVHEIPLSRPALEHWMREFGYDLSAVSGDRTHAKPGETAVGREVAEDGGARVSPETGRARHHPSNHTAGPLMNRAGAPPVDRPPAPSWFAEAQRQWPGRIDPDELDMSRWVK